MGRPVKPPGMMSMAIAAAKQQVINQRMVADSRISQGGHDTRELVAKAHRTKAYNAEELRSDEPWLRILTVIWKSGRTVRAKARIVRITRMVFDDAELRAGLDTIARLDGRVIAVYDWIAALLDPPPPTPEEREAARLAGIKARAVRAEKHARKMLKEHERGLKRAIAAVRRWRVKVRYYDKKRVANEA